MDAEKSSSKFSATLTNISIAVGAIGITLGGFYKIEDMVKDRNMVTARQIMVDVMEEQDLLTATEFRDYAEKQELRNKTIQAFTLDYMASIDSSLILIMPELSAADRRIIKRLAIIETKVDANKLPNTEDKLDRVWQFIQSQAKEDSTLQHQKQVMELLRKITEEKLKARQGDRVQ